MATVVPPALSETAPERTIAIPGARLISPEVVVRLAPRMILPILLLPASIFLPAEMLAPLLMVIMSLDFAVGK